MVDALLSEFRIPETALLYSADWYGAQLQQAAVRLGLSLSMEQLETLEAVAVARGANTRWLLLLAWAKRDTVQDLVPGDWMNWLVLETWRMHMALGLADPEAARMVRLSDGMAVAADLHEGPGWALLASLSAGATLAETTNSMAAFMDRYAAIFGEVAADEAQPAADVPFLYRPYTAELTGRGYFDHTYPTVDYGGQPNVSGMLDYLGRTNTNYDTHDADDFWMPFGSPVLAPVDGRVLWVDTVGPDYGLLIRAPGTTYDIVIVHLSEGWVTTNTQVSRGEQLGRSGHAGSTRSLPHIHFEVRHNGRQTDTQGWYGGGDDPCPIAPSGGRYGGCEAGVWLWADEAPPGGDPSPTPEPPCSAAEPATPPPETSFRTRVLLPLVIYTGPCQPR
jgi:murein DD-endopeptidase MepM/ murein hydrolase activator NlpD